MHACETVDWLLCINYMWETYISKNYMWEFWETSKLQFEMVSEQIYGLKIMQQTT